MNCSLLADEEYVNRVTELIPIWAAEGRKELTDDRCVWDWIKYNIRAHASIKKEQNNKIINLHGKTVIYTSRFVYIHQDSYSIHQDSYSIHQDSYIYIYIHQDSYI